jgi:hypothetical protein
MLLQDGSGEWFNFTERHRLKSTSALQAKAKAANAAKQIKNLEGRHLRLP